MSLLYYRKTANSAVNRNLASVTDAWNDSSNYFYELINKVMYMFLHDQYDLLTWVINMI